MVTLIDLVVLVLATAQAVEVYRHSSMRPIVRVREYFETSPPDTALHQLGGCMFCLSIWVAFVLVLLYPLPFFRILIPALAVARGANLLNDIGHKWCRTPRDDPGED